MDSLRMRYTTMIPTAQVAIITIMVWLKSTDLRIWLYFCTISTEPSLAARMPAFCFTYMSR